MKRRRVIYCLYCARPMMATRVVSTRGRGRPSRVENVCEGCGTRYATTTPKKKNSHEERSDPKSHR